jgi:arginine decarboxylase
VNFVPTRVYFAKGVGSRKEDKNARDRASAACGLSRYNIATLTSVLPKGLRVIDRAEFEAGAKEGEVIFAINGICQSNVPGMVVTAGMGMVIPADPEVTGYVVELFETPGIAHGSMEERIEKMALQIMGDQATGGEFTEEDMDSTWERGRMNYEVNGIAFDVYRQVATGIVNYQGDYTVAMIIAVLLP